MVLQMDGQKDWRTDRAEFERLSNRAEVQQDLAKLLCKYPLKW